LIDRLDVLLEALEREEPSSSFRQNPRMAQAKRWSRGEVMVRREVLNDGRAWAEIAVIVVEDTPGLLATYVPEGAPLRFPPGEWPTLDGLHPWHGKERWRGHGVLMLQRPGESYAVWVFWFGPQRTFRGWYINLQELFRRTELGYDTQDLELDIWMPVEGGWVLKDDEVLEERIREGRFTAEQVAATRAEARRITGAFDAGRSWWSDWAEWRPDPDWPTPRFP
jgi:Protein of unknown function (DUF402)